MNKPVAPLLIALMATLAACSPAKTPVNQLTFEALEKVAQDCQATGKIATDNYCKEAAVVYGQKSFQKKEAERLDRAQKEKYDTKIDIPKF